MKHQPLEVYVQRAEEMARGNGGELPPYMTLLQIDPTLAGVTRRKPQAFAHIPQSTRTRFEDRKKMYVAQAEQIAAQNNFILPAYQDLLKIDKRLAGVVMRSPELFAHIKQAPRTKNREKHLQAAIREAEKLAAQNGGALELTQEFSSKHWSLVLMIRRYPEKFAHIPRIRRKMRTVEQYVGIAERLAKKNGGKLPTKSELMTSRYPWLLGSIKNHPEMFTHIRRDRRRFPLSVRLEQAKKLAEKNNGVLPHYSWLARHGHVTVALAAYNHPDLFKGLRQEVRDGTGRLLEIRTY